MMDRTSQRVYRMKADLFKALAHPIRLRIVDALRDGERCVCEIAREVGTERSNVSHHLSLMVRVGILTSRKKGLMVYYSLRAACVLDFLSCVNTVLRERIRQQSAILKLL